MHIDQLPWRKLHRALCAFGGPVFPVLLAPWLRRHADQRDWLAALAERQIGPDGHPRLPTLEERWRLYAISRVQQTLALAFQPSGAGDESWLGPRITVEEYRAFFLGLGFQEPKPEAFSPYFHEIVSVEHAEDPTEQPSLTEVLWPALQVGAMMFSRAGVRARAGLVRMRKEVAEGSRLYWAFWRRNRPYEDLSAGWGSNSQWRTDFRCDFLVDGLVTYNCNAAAGDTPWAVDLGLPNEAWAVHPHWEGDESHPGLTAGQRRELLVHRCLVTGAEPCTTREFWPYDDWLHAPLGA